MKRVRTKLFALIAMVNVVFAVISFCVVLCLARLDASPPIIDRGEGLAWLVLDFLLVFLSLPLYFGDGILSFVKSCMKIDSKFNMVLSLTIFVESIISVIIAYSAIKDIPIIESPVLIELWALLYLAIFVLEIISIVRHIKMQSSENGVIESDLQTENDPEC